MTVDESNKDNLYVYGIYTNIISTEKHYTVLQAKYRTSAAYWLLIIFAAIGMIFSKEEIGIPIDHMIATMIICFIGLIGNCFIWYEDIINHEKLLNLNHLEGTKLEKHHQWLPQVHHQHLMVSHKTMLKFKNIFYIGCNAILFIILSFSFAIYLIKINLFISIIGFISGIILFIFLSKYMFVKAYKNELSVLKEMVEHGTR